jgi:hypothetical protein
LKREKRKLLETLVFDSGTLERLCHQSETLQNELSFLNVRVKSFGKEILFQRKMRREDLLRKTEVTARKKKLAAEISQLRSRIRVTQRLLLQGS